MAPLLGIEPGAEVYVARGCEACGQSGYKGRIGVFEGVRVDETVRRLVNEGGDEAAIAAHAFARSPTLAEAARALVLAGETTAEEAVRVSRRDAADVEVASEEAAALPADG